MSRTRRQDRDHAAADVTLRADVSKGAYAATIARILNLDGDTVRISECNLWGIRANWAGGHLITSGPHPQSTLHAVLVERPHDPVRVELLDTQTEVMTARPSLAQRHELRSGSDRQNGDSPSRLRRVVGESEDR